MSHSPYEPAEGVGRGIDPDPTTVNETGAGVAPGTAYGETYVAPVDDLYAPVPSRTQSMSAGDVQDTAADQGRRVADTAKESAGQVKDTAKEQAGQVKDTAVEQGQQVAAVAKDQALQVKDQAASSLKDIVGQSRTELSSQAGNSQNRLAEYVHSLSDELGSLASGDSDGTGPLAELAHRGARTGGDLSTWLSDHEPADVLAEVTKFARRRPFAFLGASLLAGVVVGRLTRSLAAEAKDEHDAQQTPSATTTPAVAGPGYAAPVGTPAPVGYDTASYPAAGYEPAPAVAYETPGYGTPGYVPGDLPESPAPQTWTGGSR